MLTLKVKEEIINEVMWKKEKKKQRFTVIKGGSKGDNSEPPTNKKVTDNSF